MVGFKNIILGIAIAIVFVLAAGYGISVFYEEPDYGKFCGDAYAPHPFEASPAFGKPVPAYESCKNITPDFTSKYNQCSKEEGLAVPVYENVSGCQIDVRCDPCQKQYNDARKRYSRNIFIITAVVGILGIAAGAILFGVEAVGAGLMGGGLLTILYGNIRYWEFFDKVMKFVILLAGLIILIGIGYWINRRRKE